MKILLVISVVLVMCTAANAGADDRSLEERVRALELQIQALRSYDAVRDATIRQIIVDVLDDADRRSAFLQQSLTAGWDKGFFLASADDSFRMVMRGHMQAQWTVNHQRGEGSSDRWRSGFENRRTRVGFRGHVIDPRLTFDIYTEFDRSDEGSLGVITALIGYEFADGWTVSTGKFKPPYLREALMSSTRLLAVDRSLVHQSLKQGRAQGVELEHQGDWLRWQVAVHDGFDTNTSPALMRDTELPGLTSRIELLFNLEGDRSWRQFRDFTSDPDDDVAIMIGVAGHIERDEFGTTDRDEDTLFAWTFDASLEGHGLTLFAAAIGQHDDQRDVVAAVLQGGVRITEDVELFARYEWGDEDEPSGEDLSIATAGVTWFIDGERIKAVADIGYGLNQVTDFWASSGAGWRSDAADEDGQIVLRTQLQLTW
ncbi:MAG: porin [Phycisphaerales bacterium]